MASRKKIHPPRSRRDEQHGTAVFVHSPHNFRRVRYRELIRAKAELQHNRLTSAA